MTTNAPPGSNRLDRPTTAPKLYAQDGRGRAATVFAHYFLGSSDWLITEYDPEDDLAFGWACLSGDRANAELGYVSLAELEEVAVPLNGRLPDGTVVGLGYARVEREDDWPEGLSIDEAIRLLDERAGQVA